MPPDSGTSSIGGIPYLKAIFKNILNTSSSHPCIYSLNTFRLCLVYVDDDALPNHRAARCLVPRAPPIAGTYFNARRQYLQSRKTNKLAIRKH